jgi:imidazolonepropionase-like amidohydrolase
MKRLITFLTVSLLTILAANVHAQDIKALAGATLIDGTNREPIKDAVVIIEGTRITHVGPRNRTKVPAGAQVIDVRGKFIIPGLADMHNHLGDGTFSLNQGPADLKKNLARMLGWGVTLIFDPGISDPRAFAELKRESSADVAPYPHFFAVGKQFGAKGGHGSIGGSTPETPDEARAAVRELKAANVDAVKLHYTDLIYVTTPPRPMLRADVMASIIDEAHKQGLKAYVHAPVLKYAKEVLREGADGLVHGILSEPVDDEFIALMKKNRAVYITTHAIFEAVANVGDWARREAAFDDRRRIAKEVFETGMSQEYVKQWETKWNNLAYMKERLPTLRANLRKVYDAGILSK